MLSRLAGTPPQEKRWNSVAPLSAKEIAPKVKNSSVQRRTKHGENFRSPGLPTLISTTLLKTSTCLTSSSHG